MSAVIWQSARLRSSGGGTNTAQSKVGEWPVIKDPANDS